MASRLAIGAAVLVAVGLALPLFFRPVAQVVAVKRGRAFDIRPGSVTVAAEYAVQLTSEIGGRVIESSLDEGKSVKKGDILAKLDPSDLKIDIAQTENAIQALKARIAIGSQLQIQYDNDAIDLRNNERMFRQGIVAQADLDKMRNNLKALAQRIQQEKVENDSAVKTLENTLDAKLLALKRMVIVAPFDGVLKDVTAHPGANIPANYPVATMITTTRTVEAHISEEDFAGIKVGQDATVQFINDPIKRFQGVIDRVLPTADPATQRYLVYIKLAEISDNDLTPGLNGEVSIIVGKHENALLVPRRAIDANQVLVVNGGTVEVRRIKTGFVSLTDVEVLEGLKEGELVVAEDLDSFEPGKRVRTHLLDK